jgi:hypothetical protein
LASIALHGTLKITLAWPAGALGWLGAAGASTSAGFLEKIPIEPRDYPRQSRRARIKKHPTVSSGVRLELKGRARAL